VHQSLEVYDSLLFGGLQRVVFQTRGGGVSALQSLDLLEGEAEK